MGWVRLKGVLALLALSSHAAAEPTDTELECMEAYEKTQEARQAGNLLRARALTESCIVDACHEVIRESCLTWQAELETEVPSIFLRAVDEHGNPLAGATVILDEQETLSGAGRLIELDPGTHSVEVSAVGYEKSSTTFELNPGEQETPIDVKLLPLEAPPQPEPARGHSSVPHWPAYVAGGVGIAGFSALAIFGTQARSGDRSLEDCAPNRSCSESEVRTIRTQYTAANVGLGVGIAGALGAIGWSVYALSAKRKHRGPVGLTVSPQAVMLRGSF